MSTVNALNFGDGVGSVPTDSILNGIKSSCYFNMETVAVVSSYNVASISDEGVGAFRVNHTNGMSATNTFNGVAGGHDSAEFWILCPIFIPVTTTQSNFSCVTNGLVATDADICQCITQFDLA